MHRNLRILLGYGALIAASIFMTLYWPDATPAILAGLGWFNAILLAAVFAGIVWIFAGSALDRLLEAWRDGYPAAIRGSRKNPPWVIPRRLSLTGSPQDRADYRRLQPRLTSAPGPLADETLREIVANAPRNNSAPLNEYHEPSLFIDSETGQYWIELGYEVGFNQWTELAPVGPPRQFMRT